MRRLVYGIISRKTQVESVYYGQFNEIICKMLFMTGIIMRKTGLFIFLLGLCCYAMAADSALIPPRPALPEYMYSLTDDQFGEKFFAEINLDYPGLESVRELVAQKKYPQALEAWKQVFWNRMKKLSSVSDYPLYSGWVSGQSLPPDLLLQPDTVTIKHGAEIELGLPFAQKPFAPKEGVSAETLKLLEPINQLSMKWHRPDNFDLHAHMMWHPGGIFRRIEREISRKTGDESQMNFAVARWAAIWRDWSNNSWRIAMYLKNNPAAKQAALDYYGLKEAKLAAADPWLNDALWRQLLVVIWQSQNFIVQTHHAAANFPELFNKNVQARSLAEIVYFITVWNLTNAAGNCGKGAANQRITNVLNLLDASQMLPEFKRIAEFYPRVEEDIEYVIGMKLDPTGQIYPDMGLDGAGSENSYNYMFGSTSDYSRILNLANRIDTTYPWVDYLNKRLRLRIDFQRNMATPSGHLLVLCKGAANRRKNEFAEKYVDENPPSDYTSIAFRYHGCFIMRDSWNKDCLYMAVHNIRRGAGHESEDGNKIQMEAYGRRMLISSPAEHGLFGSSWGQNTISIDQWGQSRRRLPRHGIYDTYVPGDWKSTDTADDLITVYDSGYGIKSKKYRFGQVPEPELNTKHVRQIHFDKIAKIWILVDTMIPEKEDIKEHVYTQVWNLAEDFPQNCVVIDKARHRFYTDQQDKANLFVYSRKLTPSGQFESPANNTLDCKSYYGFGWNKPANCNGEQGLSSIPETAFGWANLGSGYTGASVTPSPTVTVTFTGAGVEQVVSVIAPSANQLDPIESVETSNGWINVQLKSGLKSRVKIVDPQKLQ